MDEKGLYRRPDRRHVPGGVAFLRLGEVHEGHTLGVSHGAPTRPGNRREPADCR